MVGSYRLEASKAQRASGVCLSNSEAVTRSLTFSLHNCRPPLESLSLNSAPPVRHELISSSRHRVTLQLHRTCSVSGATRSPRLLRQRANGFSLQGTCCQYSRYLLPPCMHHRKLPNGTRPSGTTSEEPATRVQLPSYLNSFLLAISKKPPHYFFVVWINKWKLWLMAL